MAETDPVTKDLDDLFKQARSAKRLLEPGWFLDGACGIFSKSVEGIMVDMHQESCQRRTLFIELVEINEWMCDSAFYDFSDEIKLLFAGCPENLRRLAEDAAELLHSVIQPYFEPARLLVLKRIARRKELCSALHEILERRMSVAVQRLIAMYI